MSRIENGIEGDETEMYEMPNSTALRALIYMVEFGNPMDREVQFASVQLKKYQIDLDDDLKMTPRFYTDGMRIYYRGEKKRPMGFVRND